MKKKSRAIKRWHPSKNKIADADNSKPQAISLLDWNDLRALGIRYTPGHIRKLWERGLFPTPVHLSPRRLAWPRSSIEAWLAEKAQPGNGGG
jgi:predicted DNA-binding transcriptional regulator AlpA